MVWWSLFLLLLTTSASTCNHVHSTSAVLNPIPFLFRLFDIFWIFLLESILESKPKKLSKESKKNWFTIHNSSFWRMAKWTGIHNYLFWGSDIALHSTHGAVSSTSPEDIYVNIIYQFNLHFRNCQSLLFWMAPFRSIGWLYTTLQGWAKLPFPRLRECCRQVEAEVVSNSQNKIHQTWERKFSPPLYFIGQVK